MNEGKQYDLVYTVASVKADLGINDTRRDLQFQKWAIDAFRDLNSFGVLPTTITGRFKMNEDRTVDLPADFLDYNKIGLCVGHRIINFTANESLCLAPPALNCCGETIDQAISAIRDPLSWPALGEWLNTNWFYLPNFHNGQFVAGMYGQGDGFNMGNFRVNLERRQIQFDRFISPDIQEIVMEYKSSGGLETGNAYIPQDVSEAITHYIHWKRCLFSKIPAEKVDEPRHRKYYTHNVKRIAARVNAMTASEILDIVRSSIFQTPKR